MIEFLSDYIYIVVATGGWITAQLIKIILSLRQDGLNWYDLLTSGGMPSSHVSLVTSVALLVGLDQGFDSTIFGLALTVWGVVVYDSMGVRRATGENTKTLRQIAEILKLGDQKKAYSLALGHSPSQVFGGFMVGLAWTSLTYWLLG
ncbi:MAG: divergent PAP2 family protein [Candidatus Saccharibacteria bacterium]|nr:divergent PAP2 family protein [Candidatus Saccharibacteria bacterium]MCY4088958.1 divergent PAP2 family protein [Candidatus Saccharibacteria bacterium]